MVGPSLIVVFDDLVGELGLVCEEDLYYFFATLKNSEVECSMAVPCFIIVYNFVGELGLVLKE